MNEKTRVALGLTSDQAASCKQMEKDGFLIVAVEDDFLGGNKKVLMQSLKEKAKIDKKGKIETWLNEGSD